MNSETTSTLGIIARLQKNPRALSLRSRLILANILVTTIAIAALGYYILYRAEQSNAYLTRQLDTSVQQHAKNTLQTIVSEQSAILNQFFVSISGNVTGLNGSAEKLLSQESAFSHGSYWDARQSLSQLPNGSWDNANNDISSIFLPSNAEINEPLVTQLNTVKQLDFHAPNILEMDPNIIAIYFGGRSGETVYYPNVDLASLVPADFDVTQRPWYLAASPAQNPDRQVVWSDPYLDAAQNGLVITASIPVYKGSNQFRGVVAMDVQLNQITDVVSKIHVGNTGYAFLIDKNKRLIAMPPAAYQDFGISPNTLPLGHSLDEIKTAATIPDALWTIFTKMNSEENGLETITIGAVERFVIYQKIPETGYSLGIVVPSQELLTSATTARNQIAQETRGTIFVGTVLVVSILVFSILAFFIISNRLMLPLKQLSLVAEEVAAGNLNAKASVQREDEIGSLANAFNRMTSQLQETLQGLEQRVAARTRNLQLAAEVGGAVSQVRDLDVMLKDACDLILKEFNLYYVQVYLANASASTLELEAGTGSVGSQLVRSGHSLPININSINGRAAMEKRAVVISDTAQSATFRKNPLLPETRGEMAMPLIVADTVVGVLDMQSSEPGILTDEILPAFEALAGQLAVAIRNANLLAETEQARAQVEAQARRLVRVGWNEHLDAIHKPEHLGYVFDRNKVIPLAEVDESQLPDDGKAISVPITVTGERLGSLMVEIKDESRRGQTSELVNIVARQVAQQIENLRLLENAERYRHQAEKAARLQTIEGWQEYMESKSAEGLGFLYDTMEVRPQTGSHVEETSMFALPLKARDEMIGKLSVQGLTEADQDSVDLAKAVAERLSTHIESLRLFEETRSGQVELDKRARQLAAVAEVSSVSSRELEIQKMLESVVFLTQRKFGLYHAHVFTYNQQTDMLKIAACGWKEGDEHEGTHGTATIPLSQEQSLVARAARTHQPVIVNDVHNEPGWLPNPLLPDASSELAVPLIIGDKLLGVLDVQSDKLGAFSPEDASIFSTLASQISTALQNAQSFVQAQQQAERESRLNIISQKIQSATTVEAVLQIAARELGHTLGAPLTIAQLGLKESSNGN